MISDLSNQYPDATFFSFDTNFLFTLTLDNPSQFAETANYHNTTTYCSAYSKYVFSSSFHYILHRP